MIKLIGLRRALILGFTIILNLFLASVFFLWLQPTQDRAEKRLRSLEGQISQLRTDIVNIKEEIKVTRENTPYFNFLKDRGFFATQDRFLAERIIQDLRAESGVNSVRFSIEPLIEVFDERAQAANYRFVASTIKVENVEAYTDIELYKFMYMMNNSLPGHTRIKSFTLSKKDDVTTANIERLSDKNNELAFAAGSAEFQWLTMTELPKDNLNDPLSNGGGR